MQWRREVDRKLASSLTPLFFSFPSLLFDLNLSRCAEEWLSSLISSLMQTADFDCHGKQSQPLAPAYMILERTLQAGQVEFVLRNSV